MINTGQLQRGRKLSWGEEGWSIQQMCTIEVKVDK